MIHVIETALPVFLMLGLGMLCRRFRLLTKEGVSALKSVAVNIALPAVMFSAFATAEYSLQSIGIPVVMFALCVLALLLGRVFCRVFRIPGRLTPFLASGFEAGMLGYALFALLFGEAANAQFAILDLGQVLFVFTLYKILLTGSGQWRNALKDALCAPTVWAIVAGLLMGATGAFRALEPSGIAAVVSSCAHFVAAPTSALILLSIGFDLVPREIRWKATFSIVAMRIVVMAIVAGLALLLNHYVLGGVMHIGAFALMMTLPPPYVLPVFADAGEERVIVSSSLSVLTLLSLAVFAVLTAIFGG